MKPAWALFWANKRFWAFYSLAALGWTMLALSWFWLPDSSVLGVVWSVIQALIVIAGAVWLIRRALVFYGKPRFNWVALPWILVGITVPYALIRFPPPLTGFALQTASMVIRFGVAFVVAVSAWLLLASALATHSQPNSAPSLPQNAPPGP